MLTTRLSPSTRSSLPALTARVVLAAQSSGEKTCSAFLPCHSFSLAPPTKVRHTRVSPVCKQKSIKHLIRSLCKAARASQPFFKNHLNFVRNSVYNIHLAYKFINRHSEYFFSLHFVISVLFSFISLPRRPFSFSYFVKKADKKAQKNCFSRRRQIYYMHHAFRIVRSC